MKVVIYKYPQQYLYITSQMEYKIMNNLFQNEIWLWESQEIITAGKSVENHNNNIIKTNRGGNITYHNPGQRIIYFLYRLKNICYARDFIYKVNNICCHTLKNLNINVQFKWNPVGIWYGENKIGSCGFHINKQGIISHGIAINITNNTSHFKNACGQDIISIACKSICPNITMDDFDREFINLCRYDI